MFANASKDQRLKDILIDRIEAVDCRDDGNEALGAPLGHHDFTESFESNVAEWEYEILVRCDVHQYIVNHGRRFVVEVIEEVDHRRDRIFVIVEGDCVAMSFLHNLMVNIDTSILFGIMHLIIAVTCSREVL